MTDKQILVIGSSNTDMVIKSHHLPAPGETILGGEFLMNPGGKGANQAVAAARLGGNVTFICKIGDDIFGKESKENFEKEGIITDFIITDPENPSGVALITVDEKAENSIVVASGANGNLLPSDLKDIENEIKEASLVLMQLEIPIETVQYVAKLATDNRVPVILNPAPARHLPEELLANVSIITPNETEAEILTGIKVKDINSAKDAAQILRKKGIDTVIMTLGSQGAYILSGKTNLLVPAVKVTPLDTTAAGDVFNGALAIALVEEKTLEEAVGFANKAASISVTKMGAQASAPHREEIGG